MRYLALIYEEPPATEPDAAETEAMLAEYRAFSSDAAARGVLRGGDALQPVTTATTVRVRDGRVLTTDGPFAETKEHLGGYYLFECADLDEAIGLAARIPGARVGSIEIRPIWEMPEPDVPADRAGASSAF